MSEKCKACGVKWIDHLGIQGTCEQLKAAEAVIEAAYRVSIPLNNGEAQSDVLNGRLWSARDELNKALADYRKLTQPKQGD